MEKSAEVTLVDLVADPPPFGVEARPVTTLKPVPFLGASTRRTTPPNGDAWTMSGGAARRVAVACDDDRGLTQRRKGHRRNQ